MKIVVVGGGIGGSLSALAFSRGCGLPTLLLEQFGGESGAGGGIGLWGNAQLGLQSIGVRVTGRLMESAGYKVGGKWLLAPTPFEQQKDGPSKVLRSCLCLERRELQDELLKELKREPLVEIERSAVTSVAKDGSAVILANGRVVEGIQLLVGADGLHSVVRRDVFPEIKAPTFSGYTYWRGICRSRGKERAFESWSPGKRFGVVPLSGDAAFWFCVSSTKMTREDLMREFPDMAPFIAESESIQETPIFDMERARRYDKGNTVLIGDAAHVMAPNLAQGAALAIEDALQLASSFSMTNEPRAALREFSRVRIKRVHLVQRLVKAEHWVGSCDGFSAWLRNLLFWVPTFVKTPVFDSTHRWALGWSYSPPPLPRIGLYERVLGPKAFARLDQRVRHLHGGVESVMIRGEAKVISSWLARLFFGFKTYTGPFVLECTRDSRLESWKRRFGDFVFETQQFSAEGQLIESFGPLQFAFDLVPAGGGFKHVLSRLSIGKWIPLPKVISIDATTSEENKIFCGDVKVSLLGKWVLLKYNVRV